MVVSRLPRVVFGPIYYREHESTLSKKTAQFQFAGYIAGETIVSTVVVFPPLSKTLILNFSPNCKMRYVFPMAVVSILPYAGIGPNDHRGDAPHFTSVTT